MAEDDYEERKKISCSNSIDGQPRRDDQNAHAIIERLMLSNLDSLIDYFSAMFHHVNNLVHTKLNLEGSHP